MKLVWCGDCVRLIMQIILAMKKSALSFTVFLLGCLLFPVSCTLCDCCENDIATTSGVTEITTTSSKIGGNISGSGGSIVERGVCWSKSPGPQLYDDPYKEDGHGRGEFTTKISGLKPATTYYVRAYAICQSYDEDGIVSGIDYTYGPTLSFSTRDGIGLLTTEAISQVGMTSVTSGGIITDDGGSSITSRGVCWSTLPNPTIENTKTVNGTGTGTFVSSPTGLTSNTTYYLRAYAVNNATTFYGNEVSFTTL